ncbi:MAG TPA: hypothetical protein VL400_01845 [Polyangiaceae bacterium]|nr:hypothetical protein [Polyangiaceae bacterium]
MNARSLTHGGSIALVLALAACSGGNPTPSGPPPEYEPARQGPDLDAPKATTEPAASADPAQADAPAAPPVTASASVEAPPPPPPLPLAVEGANLTVGSITADGLSLKDLGCKVEGGGLGVLVLGPAIAGGLSKKKAALDACAPKGADVRVRFTLAGGKVASSEAKADDPKVEACVAKAVKTMPAVADGTCAATLHVGK